jgi:RNA-directed DNA polymerase
MDQGEWFPTEEGTPQGGPLSPLLANIALHGLEESSKRAFPRQRHTPAVIRYADDRAPRTHERRFDVEPT